MTTAAAAAGRGGLVEFYVGCSPMLLASDVSFFSDKVARHPGVIIRDAVKPGVGIK